MLAQRIEKVGTSSSRTKILIVVGNIIAFLSLFISAMVIFQEMNRRQEAERSLIHNEERFRLMVSGVKDYAILMLDPEGNMLEVYIDTPFYIAQPHGDPLDLSKSDEEIMRETEAICRSDPTVMPLAQWQAEFASRAPAAHG